MEWFIGWIVFSLLVGWFWKNKGLSFGSGFVWSLILSPLIGFIIGLLKKSNIKKQEENKIKNEAMRKCPYCAELVKQEAKVCRYCHSQLPDYSICNEGEKQEKEEFDGAQEKALYDIYNAKDTTELESILNQNDTSKYRKCTFTIIQRILKVRKSGE